MIVMYGKGSVGNGVKGLLDTLDQQCILMDDSDRNDIILAQADQIIITPGIPPSHFIYQTYPDKIIGELDLCQNIINKQDLTSKITTIGITGTDGKSTTSRITYEILEGLCDDQEINNKHFHVLLGGNFDPPISELIATIIKYRKSHPNSNNDHRIMIAEVSSFMASMINTFQCDYSIFTNFNTDHLNRHPNMKHYFESKANLLRHTRLQSFVHPSLIDPLHELSINNIVSYPLDYDLTHTHFVGDHNSMNRSASSQCVKAVCKELSIPYSITNQLVGSIQPLHHRTEYITTIDGVRIISDAHGLTGQAQKSAIEAFSEKVVLICGGSDKGFDFNELSETYRDHVVAAFCFGETKEEFKEIFDTLHIPCFTFISFEQCVYDAFYSCKKSQNILLFSPGCASFDMFRNREERANAFMKIISTL